MKWDCMDLIHVCVQNFIYISMSASSNLKKLVYEVIMSLSYTQQAVQKYIAIWCGFFFMLINIVFIQLSKVQSLAYLLISHGEENKINRSLTIIFSSHINLWEDRLCLRRYILRMSLCVWFESARTRALCTRMNTFSSPKA
jgi:hypothetical protein